VTAISWGEMWHRQRVAEADSSFFDAALDVPAPAPPEPLPVELPRASSDFAGGASSADPVGGLPDWRHPPRIERPVTGMDGWTEERKAAGVPDAPDVSAGNPRVNISPWRIV
jgi:hypothetical protein